MKKLLFVYNMHAGKGQIRAKLADIVDVFAKNGYEATLCPTQKKGDGMNRIMQIRPGQYDLLVCSGGDGTVNETITALMKTGNNDLPVGYIPAGTTNDFASSIGIPKDMLKAAATAVKGIPFNMDVGKLGERYFCYVAAFGLFTDVSYETNQDLKKILGRPAYLLEGMKRLVNVPEYDLIIDGDDVHLEGTFILGIITNSLSVGGFHGVMGQDVQLDDGLCEVILVRKSENILEMPTTVAAALNSGLEAPSVERFKTSRLTIQCREKIPWTVDGEYGGKFKKSVLCNCKRAMTYQVPKLQPQMIGAV